MKLITTTPLFYVNSVPHLGHAFSAVLSDAISRWDGSHLITGTDEHGQKISLAAAKNETNTLLFCDDISKKFENTFDNLSVNYDTFIRTTEARHENTVKALWSRIKANIILGNHQGWYCSSDENFVQANQVDEKSKTLISSSKHSVEWVSEPNYQFRYNPQEIKSKLLNEIEILPSPSRKNELLGMLSNESQEVFLSISRPRSRVPWAIPVPNDETQSIYVWFDALCGYITGANMLINPDSSKPAFFNQDDFNTRFTHVVGKDILKFHAVHWPAFLLAAGIPLPKRIIAHAHWTVSKTKMSKSLGNVVDPNQVLVDVCKGQVDVFRYFLLRDGRFEDDSDFSSQAIIDRCDADLANTLGNLVSRICSDSMWNVEYLKNVKVSPTSQHEKKRIKLLEKVEILYNQAEFTKGLESLMIFLGEANAEFHEREPWIKLKLLKTKGEYMSKVEREELISSLKDCFGNTLDSCRTAAILLNPITPQISKSIFTRLKIQNHIGVNGIKAGLETVQFSTPILGGQVLVNKLGTILKSKK